MTKFDQAYEQAEDWFNSKSKQELVQWATYQKLNIGQNDRVLDDDWEATIIDYKAQILRTDAKENHGNV